MGGMTSAPSVDNNASDLLTFARTQRAVADRAEADLLATAVDWAEAHAELTDVPALQHWEGFIPLAGEGTPEIAEFCIAELAAVLGLTTPAGRRYIGHALELAHRLPLVWARVQAGTLQAWRARQIADLTIALPPAGAAYVDDHVAPFAHRISLAALKRLVEEAVTRFDPEQAARDAARAAEQRKVDIHTGQVSADGHIDISGRLDMADAFDLDQALARRTEALAGDAEHADLSLDVRRALALGQMARADLTLDLTTGTRSTSAGTEMRVHVSADDLEAAVTGEPTDAIALARIDKTRSFITLDQLRDWLARPDARISVRTVIDTTATIRVDQWEIPQRLRTQVTERDGTCRFPHCNRTAHTDIDHIAPYDADGPPGQTATDNLADLCRSHHRHKTHGGWTYTMLEPGYYLWASPHRHRFLVTPHGTQML